MRGDGWQEASSVFPQRGTILRCIPCSPQECSHWAWALGGHSGKLLISRPLWISSFPSLTSTWPYSAFWWRTWLECGVGRKDERQKDNSQKILESFLHKCPEPPYSQKAAAAVSLMNLPPPALPSAECSSRRIMSPVTILCSWASNSSRGTHRTREHFLSTSSDLNTVG